MPAKWNEMECEHERNAYFAFGAKFMQIRLHNFAMSWRAITWYDEVMKMLPADGFMYSFDENYDDDCLLLFGVSVRTVISKQWWAMNHSICWNFN